jgi:hypothetical protein
MAHTPVDTKTGINRALALIEEMKAKLAKMVAAEEAKKAAPPDVFRCCHHPMANSFHHPTSHLHIVWSSKGSDVSDQGGELEQPGLTLKALRYQTVGPHHQGDPCPGCLCAHCHRTKQALCSKLLIED